LYVHHLQSILLKELRRLLHRCKLYQPFLLRNAQIDLHIGREPIKLAQMLLSHCHFLAILSNSHMSLSPYSDQQSTMG
jgi:hypothetical protein